MMPIGRSLGSNTAAHWAAGSGVSAVLLADCVVAVQYGVIFPVMPQLVQLRLVGGDDLTLHMGLIAGTYPLGLLLFAPLWGRWADSHDEIPALAVAMLGFSATFALWFVPQTLALLYINRFLSGAFAAAVFPISQVMVAHVTNDLKRRAQMFSWLSIALNFGYLVGPVIGGGFGEWLHGRAALRATAIFLALLGTISALLLWRLARARSAIHESAASDAITECDQVGSQWSLFALAALTSVVIAAFEVGMSLRGRAELHFSAGHLGGLMAECMLVMIAAQAIVFNSSFPARQTWRLLTPCFVVLAAALIVFAETRSTAAVVIGIAVVAASTGILFPVISYWLSMLAPGRGLAFGRQSAAANLGQMVGSASVGTLTTIPAATILSFLPAIVAALCGAALSVRLHKRLSAVSERAFAR